MWNSSPSPGLAVNFYVMADPFIPLPHAPATARNREPILAQLERTLPNAGQVLEIASGTGEHAEFFARSLSKWVWQPSDRDPENLAAIGRTRLDGRQLHHRRRDPS